jgi:hypothetical protein
MGVLTYFWRFVIPRSRWSCYGSNCFSGASSCGWTCSPLSLPIHLRSVVHAVHSVTRRVHLVPSLVHLVPLLVHLVPCLVHLVPCLIRPHGAETILEPWWTRFSLVARPLWDRQLDRTSTYRRIGGKPCAPHSELSSPCTTSWTSMKVSRGLGTHRIHTSCLASFQSEQSGPFSPQPSNIRRPWQLVSTS